MKHHLILLLLAVAFSSCKEKEEDPGNDPGPTAEGTLLMHLHSFYDEEEIQAYNIAYTNSAGRMASISLAQFYLSGFELEKPDGTWIPVPPKNILKLQDVQTYLIGKVSAGNYKRVRFKVGLNPADNMVQPEASSDSTILNRNEMWFGASAQPDGYVFVNVQGLIDTTSDLSGGATVPFIFKIGTNAHYKQVMMPEKNFTIVKDQAEYIHIYADINRMLSGIQLHDASNLTVSTVQQNADSTAVRIASNIEQMFEYE